MAPLYEFDGKGWKAYGRPQGLNVDFVVPELDGHGRVVARAYDGYFIQKGDSSGTRCSRALAKNAGYCNQRVGLDASLSFSIAMGHI